MGRGCFRNAQNSIENDWDGFTGSTSHPSSIKIWKDVGKNSTVPIGYSDLGYSGRAAYSDLNPCDEPLSLHK